MKAKRRFQFQRKRKASNELIAFETEQKYHEVHGFAEITTSSLISFEIILKKEFVL